MDTWAACGSEIPWMSPILVPWIDLPCSPARILSHQESQNRVKWLRDVAQKSMPTRTEGQRHIIHKDQKAQEQVPSWAWAGKKHFYYFDFYCYSGRHVLNFQRKLCLGVWE